MAGTETTHHIAQRRPLAPSHCVAAIACILTALASLVVAAPDARPRPLRSSSAGIRVGEYQPVRGDNFLAWQQNTRRSPGHYDVFARPLGGGGQFKVNAPGTDGANGDIDGDVLVYQQFRFKRSDLKFFDLADRSRILSPRRGQHRPMGVLAEHLGRLAPVRASVRERRSPDRSCSTSRQAMHSASQRFEAATPSSRPAR